MSILFFRRWWQTLTGFVMLSLNLLSRFNAAACVVVPSACSALGHCLIWEASSARSWPQRVVKPITQSNSSSSSTLILCSRLNGPVCSGIPAVNGLVLTWPMASRYENQLKMKESSSFFAFEARKLSTRLSMRLRVRFRCFCQGMHAPNVLGDDFSSDVSSTIDRRVSSDTGLLWSLSFTLKTEKISSAHSAIRSSGSIIRNTCDRCTATARVSFRF